MRLGRALAAALLGLVLAAFASAAHAQSCSPMTAGPASWTGIVNTYYAGTGTSVAGATSVAVSGTPDPRGAATAIAAGDLLLIIQVQDASIDSSNTSSYGGGSGQGHTSVNNSGLYEYAVATGPVSAGAVPLASPLINTYRTAAANAVSGQKRYQVVRVPQASSATVTGTVTAPPWDGATGGVVALDVVGNLNWNGQAIDVDGRGFRGGGGQCSIGSGGTWANTDYRTSSTGLTLGTAAVGTVPNGAKGEGIAGTPIIVFTPTTPNSNAAGTITNTGGTDGTSGGYPAGSFGRGAPGNGGGGGTDGNPPANDQNTGGGGGGNYGIGGKGGFGWTPLTPPGFDTGGNGGMFVPNAANRLFLGGGGGAGSSNNCTGTPGFAAASSGAAGGGLVFVRAGTTSGAGTINARGTAGNSTILNDASGGGGAGGSVLVFVDNNGAAVGATINVQGGNGGSNTGGGSPHGPGGGGSGGFAILSGTATVNAAGGANGTTATSATSTAEYGSTSSVGGFQIVNLSASQIPGAGSSRACFPQLTVTKTTSTPFTSAGGTATWTITVANLAGRSTATGLTLADALPANPNITYASTSSVALAGGATRPATTNPAAGAATPSWASFNIPGGGSVALTFVANVAAGVAPGTYQNPATITYLDPTRTAAQTVTPGGTYTNGGTVGGSNYVAASSTGEDVTVVAAPTLAKSFSPTAVNVGAPSTLTVTITNPGATALTNAGLVDTYPAGLVNAGAPGGATTCGGSVAATPGGTGFTLSGATIPAAGSCTVTVNVTMTSPGPYTNTLPAGALTNTQGVSNLSPASATLFSNVRVVKSFAPNAVAPNSDATLQIDIVNDNTTALTLSGLTDSFPANLVATGGPITVTGAGCGTPTAFAPATVAAGATSITFTTGTLAAGSTCRLSFAVRSAVTGVYANTTSGATTVQNGTTGPVSNTANLGVGVIGIAKAFAPASIVSGGTSTVTLTLTNPTGIPQTGGAFTDTLTNMAIAANQNTGGTCTPATALTAGQTALSFAGLNVPAAGCTLTFTVTSNVVGAQTNTTGGVITATLPRGPASNTATLNVLARPTIAKAFAPAAIAPGGTSTLTFTLANTSPVPLSGMSFTDAYPAGLVNASPLATGGTCTGVTTTATAGGGSFNVTAGNLPANSSCTITVQVTSAAPGSYNNSASGVTTAETGAAGTGSNTATLNVLSSPTITKAFGTSPIAQAGTSVITFTLANPNASAALTNLRFTDVLTNMSVSSATIGGTCAGTTSAPALAVGATSLDLTVPTLAGGASCTITVTVTSSTSGTHPNTTSGVTSTQTPTASAVSNTASLVVLSPPTLAKGFSPGTIQAGGTTALVFTLTNPNAGTALTNVSFSDTLVNMALGAGAAVVETCAGAVTPVGVAAASTSFTLTLNTLNAGESCTITVSPATSSIGSAATGHPNTTSTVTSTQTSVNRGAAASANLIVYAPPTVTKSFAPAAVALNGTSVVTFTVTNPNALALTDIRFTDDLPANLTNTAAQTFVGGARGTCTMTVPTSKVAGAIDPITFNAINLGPGASCTVMMDVTSATAGFYTNTVSNIVSDQTPTATTGGSDVLTVGARMLLTETFTPASIEVGGTTTMRWVVNNNNAGNNQNGIDLTTTLPAGLAAVGGAVTFTSVSGTCTFSAPPNIAAGATTITLTDFVTDVDAGEVCAVDIALTATTVGDKAVTVTAPAAANPTSIDNASDTQTLIVYARPTIAKAFAPATIAAGETSTLTFTLANTHPTRALTNASFTDTLTNMSASGAQNVGGTCVGITPATLANGATALAFSGITIPPNGSCTVTVVVTSTVPGVQPNTASGVTTTQTPTAGANSGVVNLTVGGVNITKAFSPTARPLGVPTTLTLTLTSTQAVAWDSLAFTDTLPANLVVANPANVATTCGAGTVTAAPGTNVVSLSGGTMAAGASPCTVTVSVVSAVVGTYNNVAANFSGLSPGVSATGASATATYFNNATVTKAFSAANIAPGGTTVLTFTLTNPAGAQAVTGLGFTDTLPAGVTVAGTPAASTTCGGTWAPVAGVNVLTLSGAALGAGVATCTAQVTVTATTLGTYTNNAANFSALAGGLTAATANASFSVRGTTLTKAFAPTSVGPNVASTLTFTITNGTGNPAQAGLGFTDSLPANLVVATPPAATNTCGGTFAPVANATSVTLSGGALAAAQATCTLSVNVVSAQVGTYANTAANISGTSSGLDAAGVNATLNVLQPVTAAKAFGATSVALGANTSLTLTFTNANNTAVAGLAFTDTFPTSPGAMTYAGTVSNSCGGTLADDTGGALAAGDPGIRLTGGSVPANGSCSVVVNVTAAAAGAYTNTLAANTITSTNAGSVATATSANVTFVAAPTIAKAFASPIGVGQASTLTFTLANPNPAVALTGVAFGDTFPVAPAAMVVASPTGATASAGCGTPTFAPTAGAASIAFSNGTIAAGATCTVTVNVTAPVAGTYANTSGTVSATGPVAVTNPTAATANLAVVQATLSKAFTPDTIDQGGVTTLRFILTNGAGNPAQSGIGFTDNLPAGLVAATPANLETNCPAGGAFGAPGFTVTPPATVSGITMNAGVATCEIRANFTSATPGTYTNAAANFTGVTRVDVSGANATLTVRALPTLTKAFAPTTVGLGQPSTLTFTITNPAGAPARSGLTFTDALPAGLVVANPASVVNGCGGTPTITATPGAGTFTVGGTGVNAAAGASTCTITVNVASSTAGSYVNGAAQVTAIAGMLNGVTNQTLTVVQPSVSKAFGAAAVDDGGATTLVFTLANGAGNPAQAGLGFTETLPASLRFTATPLPVTYGAGCSGPATVAATGTPLNAITLSGLAMTSGTASCTVTVGNGTTSGVGNVAGALNASCAATPAAFTNQAANVTALANLANAVTPQCLVVNARPTLTKAFGAAALGLGQSTTLAFSIGNTGTGAVNRTGLSFTDTLPAGLVIANPPAVTSAACGTPAFTAADGTQPFTASGIAVAAGATCTITLTVRGTTLGAKVNGAAQITAIAGIDNAVTDQTTTVVQPALTKAFAPAAIDAGGVSTLTFTLANGAGNPAQGGINFTDTLPAGVVVAATPNVASTCPSGVAAVAATAGTGTITVTNATMAAAQASCTVSVDVTSGAAGTYTNNATNISAAQRVDATGVNATLTVRAVPVLTKAFAAASLGLGQSTTLTFTIPNTGTNAVNRTGLAFTDTLPAGLVIANPPAVASTACGTPAFTAADGTQPFTASGIAVTAGATCTITLTVRGTTLGAKVNGAAQMSALSGLVNGVTDQTVTVVQAALTKAFAPAAIDVNGVSTLTFTLANGAGNPAQGGINFTDTLPAGVVVAATPNVASTCPSGTGVVTAAAGAGTITVTNATMSAAQASCTLSVDVTSATAATYTNNATNISATQRVDATGVNATLTVRAAPVLTKAFGAASLGLGQSTTLVFSIANTGTNAVNRTGLAFTDTLPAGLVIANPPAVTSAACGTPAFTAVDGTQPFTASGIAVNAGATCTITLTVRGTTLGAKVNGAAQISAVTGMTNAVTDQTVTVVQAALTKAFAPAAIDVNGVSTLTFTLANGAGNPAQGGINFTETLPAGVVVAGTPGVASTCPSGTGVVTATAGSGTITVTGASMNAAQASCTISVAVTSATAGTYTNNAANISAIQRVDATGVNATLTVRAAPALTKAFATASLGLGQSTTLTFSIANTGTNAVNRTGLAFTDTLPAGLVIANPPAVTSAACGTPTFTAADGTQPFTASGIAVNAGATCTITLTVRGTTLGAKVNGAAQISAITGLENGVTNQTVTVVQAALAKAFAPAAIDVNGVSTLTFTLANGAGNPAQSGINFTDTLPAGLVVAPTPNLASTCPSGTAAVTATAASGTITVTGASLNAAQASCTISVDVTSAAAATYTNNAGNLSAAQRIDATGVNAALTVRALPALAKAFGAASLGLGQTTTLTFSIANTGTNAVNRTGLSFTDTLPAGLVIANPPAVSSAACGTPAFTAADGTQPFSASGIAVTAGATCTITVGVRGTTLGAKVNGAAQITAIAGMTNGVTDQTVTVVQPALTKAFAPAAIDVNGVSTLTFTLANGAGNPAQGGINFTDTLPAGVVVAATPNLASTCPSGTGALAATAGGGTITVTNATMNAAQASCTLSVDVTSAAAATYTNNATNISATQRVDASGANATLTVRALPALTKAFGATDIGLGQTTTLTFTIANTGTNAVNRAALAFTDTLVAGLVVANPPVPTASASCGTPTFTAANGTQPFTASGIAVNAGATCTITMTVRGTTLGAKLNNAANLAVTGLANAVTPQTVTVSQATLTKGFAPAAIDAGGVSTLTFTLANSAGNPAQGGIDFTDTLPAGLAVAAAPNVASTCPSGVAAVTATGGSGAVVVAGASISAGQASCTISVDVTASSAGTYVNNATNFSAVQRVDAAGASATLTVADVPALTKAFAAASLGIGQSTTLTFTIANTGTNAANRSGLAFTDTLPAGLVIANPPAPTASAGCGTPTLTAANNTQPFTASNISVNAGATCTITLTVRGTTLGAKVNNAASISGLAGLLNGVTPQTVTVVQAALDKAFVPATINLGGTSTLTFTLTNGTGNPAQAGIGFTDNLPGNVRVAATPNVQTNCPAGGGFGAPAFTVTATAGSAAITVAGATMASGVASCQVRVDVTANTAGAYTNNAASITGTANVTNAVNASTLTVNATAPTVTKGFTPASISSGQVSTLVVTLGNPNAVPITVSSVTDTFPATPGTGLVRAATPNASTTCAGGSVTSTAGSVTLSNATVPANGTCTFQVDVTAATAGSYVNTIPAGAIASTAGSNTVAGSATLTVTAVANVAVAKSGAASVGTNGALSYTVVISNAGPDPAGGTTFTDNVPAQVTGVAAACGSATGGAACGAVNLAGNAVTGTVPTLPAGGSVTITITGTATGVGSITNTATVAAPAGTTDPSAANNTSSVTTTILAPDLAIAKTHAGNFTVGTNGTFTITVSNGGTLATSGLVTVTDALPTGLGFVSASGTGWTCGFASGTATCTSNAAIAIGASAAPITLVVSVAAAAAPSVTNFASVAGGNEPAALAANNTASDNVLVGSAAVSSFFPDNAQTAMPGTVVFYPHTFTAGTAGTVAFTTSAVQVPSVNGWTQLVYRDFNCNGQMDGADGNAVLTGTIAVNAGDTACILVKDSIPAAAPYNGRNTITVTATLNGSQSFTRTDLTTVGASQGAGLTLAKTVRNVTQGGAAGTSGTARPNDILEYTITYTNASASAVSSIVITDATPAFTTFQAAGCGPLPGNVSSCVVTSQPAVNAAGSVVWTLGGSLLSNGSGTVVYTVRVAP